MRLAEKNIAALSCPAGKKDKLLFDSDIAGLGVRVGASGSKTFLVQYRAGSAKRRLVLGKFGVLTVEQARTRARIARGAEARRGDRRESCLGEAVRCPRRNFPD